MISVVIPNYNGAELLRKNLPTVQKALQAYGGESEIIVSDDNSNDESLNVLRNEFPNVIVCSSEKNEGFAKNINKGLRRAKGEFVLALNSDVSLSENYFQSQIPKFQDPNVFGIMGALKDPANDKTIVGAKLCQQNIFGHMNSTKNIIGGDKEVIETFYLSGANALMRASMLKELNYFSEIYSPFYKEDVDLSLRAWRMGWLCLFDPEAVAYHETSSTIGKFNRKPYIEVVSLRNRYVLHAIHLAPVKRIIFYALLVVQALTRWVSVDTRFYKSIFAFLSLYPQINEQLQKQPEPKISTEDVLSRLQSSQRNYLKSVF